MFEDDLELFGGTSIKKWLDIIKNASPTLVEVEVSRIFEYIAGLELFLEDRGFSLDEMQQYIHNLESSDKEDAINAIATESMGNILGAHE